MLKIQDLLRTTDPENFSSIAQIFLKISFLKSRNNLFSENELLTFSSRNVSKNKTLVPQDSNSGKNKNSIFYRIVMCTATLTLIKCPISAVIPTNKKHLKGYEAFASFIPV